MKKNLKISNKSYETIFSFHIEGEMGDLIVPTPPPTPPTPPTPPPTPEPIIPPFPPLNIPPSVPPGTPVPPSVPPYYTPQTWVEILCVETVMYRYVRGMYSADNEQGLEFYTEQQQQWGWGYSFPTDWGTTETMVGYYPSKDFVPIQASEVTLLAILNFYSDDFFTDINSPPDWYNPFYSYPSVLRTKTTSFIVNPSGPSTIG